MREINSSNSNGVRRHNENSFGHNKRSESPVLKLNTTSQRRRRLDSIYNNRPDFWGEIRDMKNIKEIAQKYNISNELAKSIYNNGITDNFFIKLAKEMMGFKYEFNKIEIFLQACAEVKSGVSNKEEELALSIEGFYEHKGQQEALLLFDSFPATYKDMTYDLNGHKVFIENKSSTNSNEVIESILLNRVYTLFEISQLQVLADVGASNRLLTAVSHGKVLFQHAYTALKYGVNNENIVETCVKRKNNEITAQQFIDSGTVMTSPQKGCQENQTFDECLAMYKEQVAKAANEAEAQRKLVADNINTKAMLSPKVDISSKENLFPLTSQMSSSLGKNEMSSSSYSPTNSNALAYLGSMLSVSYL
ncbi:TPA: hypothetical protein ACPTCW_001781 [Yersinia enterocolitica]